MAKTHGGWIWYELMTTDAGAAKAFYEAVVPGWTMTPGTAETGHYGFIANADGGMTGGMITLTDEMLKHGAKPTWIGYLGVDDVDAILPQVEAKGGKVLMQPHDVPMAGRMAMVADCCGAPFYIMTPTPPPGGGESTAFSPSLPGRCGWNELSAGNQANAIAFYTGLFGWGLPEPMDMGPMGTYQFIEHEGVPIGAIMQKRAERPAPVWQHYFRVASIAEAASRVAALGGTVTQGPHEVPGDDWIIVGLDPQGAEFCLVGGK